MHSADRHVATMLKAVPAAASPEDLQRCGPNGEVRYPLTDRQAEPLGLDELTFLVPAADRSAPHLDGRPDASGAAIKVSSATQQCFDLPRYPPVT